MTNAELIKALRSCSSPRVGSCMDCPYYKCVSCKWQMMEDAADALEAAEQRIEELEARLPKEGEWQWDEAKCMYRCSVCKSPKAREDMDRKIVKEQPFCYNCGARCK